MSVLACGLNTSGQVVGGGPGVLCCPAPVCVPPGVTAARVAFSHILWSTDGVMYCGSVPVALQVKVRDVAVGKEHSMALTVAGDVLTWGSGMRGQLGIGELCQSEKPVPVESLQGVPVTAIACGAWHCVALSGSGDLYVWGWNESGQLGFPYKCEGSQSLFSFFEHSCRCPKSDVVKQGTDDHSTREPMQSDQYGQLGLGHVRAVQEPCRVFRGGVRGMCAGGWNSVFLTAEGHPTP
ncbi:RCC1 domain-containing protein 1 [Chionoecetes opilio]|uniref:RCC1 domain-containing protein 1 n=1 Tax=Chionoecetes opilio TaxID=41210 RepID=A0A8J8WBB6_CHIOP|nr:RCC1 domain-containing protein 1 [Chionoecetes opilio]